MKRALVIFIFTALWLCACWSAQIVSGDISGTMTLYMSNNPIQIRGNVRVLDGATLLVEPGVNIFFEANSSLTVEGSMGASGNATLPIVFTSFEGANYYTRLIFSSAENSLLSYCSFGRSDDWTGLMRIENSSNITLSNCSLGTSINSHGLYINNSSVNIGYLDINNVGGSGVYITGNSSVVNLYGLFVDGCATGVQINWGAYPTLNWDEITIHHSSSYPIIANLQSYAGLDNLSVSWAGVEQLNLWDSTVYASYTLPRQNLPYYLPNSLTVSGSSTLTLEAGTGLRFNNHGRLTIDNGASLQALGTELLPISFAPAAASTWKGIAFNPNSTGSMDYCQFSGCGYPEYGYPEPTINVNAASILSISNTIIPGGTTYGIYWDGSNEGALVLDNVSIVDCPWTGLFIRNSYIALAYSNLSISDCGRPIAIPANLLNYLDEQPLFVDNADNRIFLHLDGYVRRLTFVQDWGYPYVCESIDIIVNYEYFMIQPGCVFHMGYNTGFSCNGVFMAIGTPENPILFTRLPGSTQNWRGFRLDGGINDAHFNYCILEHCASSNQYNHVQDAFTIYRANTVLIENTQIIDAVCRGIYIESSDSTDDDLVINNLSIDSCGMDAVYQAASGYNISINGLSVNGCNSYPLSISANWAHQIGGITLTNNAFNVIRFVNGGYLVNQTLANHGYPYQISGGQLYVNYTTVMFLPGTVFYFERYRSLEVSGTLTANGTAEQPIVFDRPPGAGYFWDRIYLYNNSSASFSHCQFHNCGERNQYGHDNAFLDNAGATMLSLQNCLISNVDAQAISCHDIGTGDTVQISNSQITGCRTDGFWCNDDNLSLTADNLSISGCLRNPLAILPMYAGSFSNLTLSGNTSNSILLFGYNYLYGSVSFPNHGYIYRCESGLYGAGGSSITIAPGAQFQIADNQYIYFYGALSAIGTEADPIIFTRYPSSTGYWRGMVFTSSSWDIDLAHCQILYAGSQDDYGSRRAIQNAGAANVSISDCLIQFSYGDGIVCSDMQAADIMSISDLTMADLGWSGFVANNAPDFALSVNGMSVSNPGGAPISCSADLMDKFINISIVNPGNPYIVISSYPQTRSATWPNFGLPYKLNNAFVVNDWVTLSIAAGTEIVFANYVLYSVNTSFTVYGALNTLGTLEAPVVFRGLDAELPSTWVGLRISNPDAVCSLNHTAILNAGLDENYSYPDEFCALYIYNGTVNLTGCRIAVGSHNLLKLEGNGTATLNGCQLDSAVNGIIHNSGTLNLVHNTISGLSGTGLIHNGGSLNFGSEPSAWNRVFGNTLNLRNNTSSPKNALYTCWGSVEADVIDAAIWDNEEGTGMVNFEPWYDADCQVLYYYPLDAPEGVTLTELNPAQLRISWLAVNGATGYKVLAASDPEATQWTVLQQGITGTQISIDVNPALGKCFYKVVAVR